MDNEALIQRLMVTFLDELEEHVAAMNDDLLALEKEPTEEECRERLKTLFRAAHSLKGAARSVNQRALEGTCHILEELLAPAREGNLTLESEHLEVMFSVADALAGAGHQLRAREQLDEAPLAGVTRRLEELLEGGSPEATAPSRPQTDAAKDAQAVAAAPTDDSSPKDTRIAENREAEGATVRVAASKLDSLLAQAGELQLIVSRLDARSDVLDDVLGALSEWEVEWGGAGESLANGAATNGAWDRAPESLSWLARELGHLVTGLNLDRRALKQALTRLSHHVSETRMLPFGMACEGIERAVRDVASAVDKEAVLEVVGESVGLDRSILEALRAPLLHLVRNAVDHGIETPGERQAAGKPIQGRVTVTALLRGSTVEVSVEDDGRGLDVEAIRSKAANRGGAEMDEADVRQLVFQPGLSTAKMITEVSGRGVGLDVVAAAVEGLRGTVDVEFIEGRGARFLMTLPLTLTTMKALLVRVGNQVLAIPSSGVRRVLRADRENIRSVEGRNVLLIEAGASVVFAPLAVALGLSDEAPAAENGRPVIVLTSGRREAAFAVDELLEERDVLIKSMGPRLHNVRNVSGATILPDGQPAIILNPAGLVRASGKPTSMRIGDGGSAAEDGPKTKVLVVDDSLTSRTMLKSVLEGSGFEVRDAVDGVDGWRLVEEWVPDIVVSDVEMPRMNGFAFTETIRRSTRFANLPVILATARSTVEDRARGLEAGANAYLVKSNFDQGSLLDAIRQLEDL